MNTQLHSEPARALIDDGLDPQIRAFQQALSAGYAAHADLSGVPLAEARRIAELVRAPFARGGPAMARTLNLRVEAGTASVRIRVHLPFTTAASAQAPRPALVYLHGGGWTLFSIDTHDRLMREYAERAGVAVVGVDYALAPEMPFPHALQQVVAVVAWLRAQGATVGVDGDRLALGGDSAGANLAIAAALLLRGTEHARALRAMVLNYGAYSREVDRESHRRYSGPAYLLTADEMLGFWRRYLGDWDGDDPLAQPLRARLQGLPPAFLAIAECDVLHDENQAMAERLTQAGVPTTAVTYPGTTHGFVEAMAMAEVSRRALDETSAWLRRQFGLPVDGDKSAPR